MSADGSGFARGPKVKAKVDLAEVAKGWQKQIREHALGVLFVAPQIVDMASAWTDEVAKEMGHATYTSWLKATINKNLSFFARSARALTVLGGKDQVRCYEHPAAVYVAGIGNEDRRKRLHKACMAEYGRLQAEGKLPGERPSGALPPLSRSQVMGIREALFGKEASSRKETLAAKLRAEIEALREQLSATEADRDMWKAKAGGK